MKKLLFAFFLVMFFGGQAVGMDSCSNRLRLFLDKKLVSAIEDYAPSANAKCDLERLSYQIMFSSILGDHFDLWDLLALASSSKWFARMIYVFLIMEENQEDAKTGIRVVFERFVPRGKRIFSFRFMQAIKKENERAKFVDSIGADIKLFLSKYPKRRVICDFTKQEDSLDIEPSGAKLEWLIDGGITNVVALHIDQKDFIEIDTFKDFIRQNSSLESLMIPLFPDTKHEFLLQDIVKKLKKLKEFTILRDTWIWRSKKPKETSPRRLFPPRVKAICKLVARLKSLEYFCFSCVHFPQAEVKSFLSSEKAESPFKRECDKLKAVYKSGSAMKRFFVSFNPRRKKTGRMNKFFLSLGHIVRSCKKLRKITITYAPDEDNLEPWTTFHPRYFKKVDFNLGSVEFSF